MIPEIARTAIVDQITCSFDGQVTRDNSAFVSLKYEMIDIKLSIFKSPRGALLIYYQILLLLSK